MLLDARMSKMPSVENLDATELHQIVGGRGARVCQGQWCMSFPSGVDPHGRAPQPWVLRDRATGAVIKNGVLPKWNTDPVWHPFSDGMRG